MTKTIKAVQLENFDYVISYQGLDMVIRELCIKDYYIGDEIELHSFEYFYTLFSKCCKSHNVDELSLKTIKPILNWFIENLYSNINLNDWYKTSYFLLRGRWGSDLDWLESQPMSRLLKMIEMMNLHFGKLT